MVAAFAIVGRMERWQAHPLIKDIIDALEMSPAPGSTMCTYPVPETGKGGIGFTLFQPITDSFLAIDAWPLLDGFYVVIASCKPFLTADVWKVIAAHGYTVADSCTHSLRLPEAAGV